MPAAGWAAKSGNPILWVTATGVPPETEAALKLHKGAKIYVLGPEDAVPGDRVRRAGQAGDRQADRRRRRREQRHRLRPIPGRRFGWYVVDPGHGLVFANARRPQDAAAAAPLSAHGTYGPLLLSATTPAPSRSRCRTTCWTSSPATTRPRPRPRRLQPRLDHRRRERHGGRRPGPHRYSPRDPARQYRSRVSTMAEAEQPERLRADREVTVDDIRQLVASATPHFSYQIRNRVQKLVAGSPPTRRSRLYAAGDRQAREPRLHRRGPRHARAGRHARCQRERARAAPLPAGSHERLKGAARAGARAGGARGYELLVLALRASSGATPRRRATCCSRSSLLQLLAGVGP